MRRLASFSRTTSLSGSWLWRKARAWRPARQLRLLSRKEREGERLVRVKCSEAGILDRFWLEFRR